MFDDTTPIQRGAVVSCRFPLAEDHAKPGPSARPALVIRTFFDAMDGIWKVIVAYGTSRSTRANAGYEIQVRKPEHLEAAGLHRPTRFTLSRMRILPLDREFFAYAASGSPILGYLPTQLMDVLERHCQRLVAITDRLRCLVNGADDAVASDTASAPRGKNVVEFDSRKTDSFFQQALTGRANISPEASKAPGAQEAAPRRAGGRRSFLGRR